MISESGYGVLLNTLEELTNKRMRELNLHGDRIVLITDGLLVVEAAESGWGRQYSDPGFRGPTKALPP